MMPLARLWTWTGHLFIPVAVVWAFYVRNGLFADKPPTEGAAISRAYWGLLVSLAAGAVLSWTVALYASAAKGSHSTTILIPANTTFEDETNRNLVISWASLCVFSLAIALALSVFGVRYGDSLIHTWDAQSPLDHGFWSSRIKAYALGCTHQPCFAVGQRLDATGPIYGVNEYILYVTDGAILLLAAILVAGLVFLIRALRRKSEFTFE